MAVYADRAEMMANSDFAAFLLDKESEAATQELLKIPGFAERFVQGQEEITKGQTKTLPKTST